MKLFLNGFWACKMYTNLFGVVLCIFLFDKPFASDSATVLQRAERHPRILGPSETNFSGYDFSKGKSNPIVSTKAGKLEGYVMKSIKGRSIYAFEGVPFAETTGGANRFELAIPKTPWSGVRSAKNTGPDCLQVFPFRLFQTIGAEDCLFVNIYVPSKPITKNRGKLPVIVWIHGGSWYFGAGAFYGPTYLLEHDVIFVTINYRLGILGFLSTGDEYMPGNLGHKDQRSALKYIYENIENFGGDPARITIAGQSSGAASVHYHILANSSHKYFSGAISMSGNAFCPWTLMTKRHMEVRNRKLATSTNCPLNSSREFVACLRKIDGHVLVRKLLNMYDLPLVPVVPLGVVIEENLPGAFITEHPDDTYANNRAAKVPYICSGTSGEVSLSLELLEALNNTISLSRGRIVKSLWRDVVPQLLDYKYVADNPDMITEKISDFYFGANDNDQRFNFEAMSQLSSDRMFGYGTHKTLQAHSQIAPTYSYFYGYQGRNSVIPSVLEYLGVNAKGIGVGHADDLASVVNLTGLTNYRTTDPEYAVVKLVTSMWYNFAAERVPFYTDEGGNVHQIWDPITDPKNIKILQINKEVKMIPEQFTQRLKFWETLGLDDMKPAIIFK